uniref:Tryptophan synthase beta chain-like PALP domain-containing protein n=1 Tax=Mucochytrium quahogii TaxID=96639 RepID=A0A7S2RSJ5_9STRA|mmetsp:Transcript_4592/g.6844  ORF Transcript_4592/g.6844 Transcript_4592/m.6844 type:complete len:338 (-) Transcript_4592:47-1060(-)
MAESRLAAQNVVNASKRIAGHVYRTPLQRALWLEKYTGAKESRVFLKLESEQVTGSFKARGAMNKVMCLTEEEKAKGVITASTGNHALAVTHAAQESAGNLKFEIVLPNTASAAKVELLKALGAPVRFFGDDCLLAEEEAIRISKTTGQVYVSPYNDKDVLAGQGTLAVEILEQLGDGTKLDAIFVPVGGGGLISGVASYIKSVSPETKVYGCNPKNDAHMARSVAAGELIDVDSYTENGGVTLSEGTAGAVEQGSITFPICQQTVDEWMELTEEEIGLAVTEMLDKHHKAIEGAAGLGIAAYKRKAKELAGKNVAIVLCGGNVKASMIRDVLNKYL